MGEHNGPLYTWASVAAAQGTRMGLSGCLAAPEDRAFPLAPSVPKAYPANLLRFVLDCWGQGTLLAAEATLLIEQLQANIFLNRIICNDCSEPLEQSEVGHRGQCWLS